MHTNKKRQKESIGVKPAHILLKNCRMVNVLSGEIEETDIAVAGGDIVGVGAGYEAETCVEVGGRFVYPGLIDAHIHLESTKLTVLEAGRMMAACGTAAAVTDPHEIANVAGMDGVKFQMDSARLCDLIDVFFTAPSCVPTLSDPAVETAASVLGPDDIAALADMPQTVALGEMMNVPGVLGGSPDALNKIEAFVSRHRAVDGHAPMLYGKSLNAYIYAGMDSDHESTSLAEAREKLRRGMAVMIREGSSEKNLDALMPLISPMTAGRIMFASDDLDPTDLQARGHINHLVSRAVAAGVDPILALQMATIFPAVHFGLQKRHGAIFPGAQADLVIAPDLEHFVPDIVYHRGRAVYQNGRIIDSADAAGSCVSLPPSMHVKLPNAAELQVPAHGKAVRVIEAVPGQIVTRESSAVLPEDASAFVPDASQDIAKICVFDRHRASGSFGIGFVRGFGIKFGAFGSSVAHDSHNLIVVGMNDADILRCAQIICDMEGGQAALAGDNVVRLPLPVAGLMSRDSAENVIEAEKNLEEFCENVLGISFKRPFAALSFMALPVIPELRITDQGLFRVDPGAYPLKINTVIE